VATFSVALSEDGMKNLMKKGFKAALEVAPLGKLTTSALNPKYLNSPQFYFPPPVAGSQWVKRQRTFGPCSLLSRR